MSSHFRPRSGSLPLPRRAGPRPIPVSITVRLPPDWDAVVMPATLGIRALGYFEERPRVRLGWIAAVGGVWIWPVPPGSGEPGWPVGSYLPACTPLTLRPPGDSRPEHPPRWIRRHDGEVHTHPVVLRALLTHLTGPERHP
ncbi:hypothetical protein [Streptomyces alkaliphilus]|uniref:Uncharacterized protein n=1 Tax=Streptomyces alkaliphilus TaxID=1472722 RepID=A0A646IG80_9ACTN|nr:hypothetical protein [Streptomyces alkaliphilus]MQS09908.1 hypothetical protein [Streptomyces alkaliphilus]